MMDLRYFIPILGAKLLWDDDQQWLGIQWWHYLLVILWNSILITACLFFGNLCMRVMI
jgi:hypothetical protein